MMKKKIVIALLVVGCCVRFGFGQAFDSEPVFRVKLVPDRTPVVAGEELYLAVVIDIDHGWHVNSDEPGDEFSIPTSVEFELPDKWPQPYIIKPLSKPLCRTFIDTFINIKRQYS